MGGVRAVRPYQECSRCVMDTSAEEIQFDSQGVCSFCRYYDENVADIVAAARSPEGRRVLTRVTDAVRRSGRMRRYDCVLGLSGGTDSSYLAHRAVELGLRPLLVHVDTGWDSEAATHNITALATKLGLDLKTVPVDPDEMRDVQLAFYRAGVRNCEIPQDHAFLAVLYRVASELGLRYILVGGNLASESILPRSWGHNAMDLRYLLAIHRRFGSIPKLRHFPTLSIWDRYLLYPLIKGIRQIRLLDYLPYNRQEAKSLLAHYYGLKDYGRKHCESVLTRFFQCYYLPVKFGIDKRRAHFSSLILSGQMAREEAVKQLEEPPYPGNQLEEDMSHVARKLGLSLQAWKSIVEGPTRSDEEFPTYDGFIAAKNTVVRALGLRRWLARTPH